MFVSFLFLMKNLLTFYGCTFDDVLKEIAYWLTVVRNWPGVMGHFAAELFEIVHGELKCKGTAFRRKIRADFPSIDMKISENISKKVVILSNQAAVYNSPASCSLMNLRKLMIYNILGCCDNESAIRQWKNL